MSKICLPRVISRSVTDLRPQGRIDLEDFGTVNGGRVFTRFFGTERDVTGGKVVPDISHIEFVLQGNLNFEPGESHGSQGSLTGSNPSDSSDEKISFREIEKLADQKSRYAGSGVYFCSSESAANLDLEPVRDSSGL